MCDLPADGRTVVLAWRKRIWRCRQRACEVWTWTEHTLAIGPRVVLTERARAEAFRWRAKTPMRLRRLLVILALVGRP
jgi:hypothetical protein